MRMAEWWRGAVRRVVSAMPDPAQDVLGAASLPHSPAAAGPSPRFCACVAEVLRHEGGFVNQPSDPGGFTNRGITLATLSAWRGRTAMPSDIRALTEAEAKEIYRAKYWDAIRGDSLPAGVDLAVFDFAVNSGPGRAARALQSLVGVTQDGAIGPKTLAAVGSAEPARLASDLCRTRLAWMRGLPTWVAFGRGWERRVLEVEAQAVAMGGGRA